MEHKRSAPTLLFLTAFSILAACVAWKASRGDRHIVTTDSCGYLSIASNLMRGRGFRTDMPLWDSPDERQVVLYWPPLVPTAIAALNRIGIPPESGGLLLSAISFGLLVATVGLIGYRLAGRAAAVFGSLACLLWWPIASQSLVVMSEMPFTAFSTVALYCCLAAGDSGRARWFAAAAAFVSLSMLTRYIGTITLAVFFAWCVWLIWSRRATFWQFSWPILALLPAAAWVIHNDLVYGHLTGHTIRSAVGLRQNVSRVLHTLLADWLPMPALHMGIGSVVKPMAIAFAVIGALLLFAFALRFRARKPFEASVLLLGYAAAYLIYLTILASIRDFDAITTRLTMPAYPAILICVCLAGATIAKGRSAAAVAVGVLAVSWLALAGWVSLHAVASRALSPNFARNILREPSAHVLQELPESNLASDDPARAWYICRRPVRWLPNPSDVAETRSILQRHGLVLVLFRQFEWRSPSIVHESDLRAEGVLVQLKPLSQQPDCDIFQVP